MTSKRFYRRRFLNRRGFHAGAYVLAECRVDTFGSRDGATHHSIDAEITISDCGRIATLDFSINSDPAAHNALHKARLLRDVLIDFTDALEAAVTQWRELNN